MHDLRDAFRALKATPTVSIIAALSLALGIGANTAIFSILDSLILRSLPVKEPQRLALFSCRRPATRPGRIRSGSKSAIGQISSTARLRGRPRD
jgi:hypothetical protein